MKESKSIYKVQTSSHDASSCSVTPKR